MKNWRMLLISTVLFAGTANAAPQVVDKVAAVVNNGVVLESDVDGMMRSVKSQAQQTRQQLPDDATLRHQIIERLIVDNVILQMGKQMNLQISDQQLDQAIANIAAQNHLSVDKLRSRLAYDGISYPTYREQIRKEMLIAQVRNNAVRQRITILPQEVDALAEQLGATNMRGTEMNLSHILLPLPENPSQAQVDDQEKLARQLISELHSGADFGKLAVTYSADPQALQGGNMGWSKIEELPGLFAQALQTAKRGDIIGPIRSGVGFHIIKVNDLRGGQQAISVTEVLARHILLKTSPVMDDAQAQATLQRTADEIKNGKITFAAAAKQLSDDPGSAHQGGDLGWSSPEAFDPAFRNALLHLQKGELSAPVRSSFGWHLIQLMDTRQVDKTDAAQKERAYRLLFNRKFAEEAQTWMQEQRAAAYVNILDNGHHD